MTLRAGEVVLIRIDFHQTPGGKLRPAVVLLDSGDDDFVGAPVTSRLRVSDFDVPIQQSREAGGADRTALTEVLRPAPKPVTHLENKSELL